MQPHPPTPRLPLDLVMWQSKAFAQRPTSFKFTLFVNLISICSGAPLARPTLGTADAPVNKVDQVPAPVGLTT